LTRLIEPELASRWIGISSGTVERLVHSQSVRQSR